MGVRPGLRPDVAFGLAFPSVGGAIASSLCELRRRADEDRRAARQNELQALAEANRLRREVLRAGADLEQLKRMLEHHLGQAGTGAAILHYGQLAGSASKAHRIDCGAVVRSAVHTYAAASGLHWKHRLRGLACRRGVITIRNAIQFRGEERLKGVTAASVSRRSPTLARWSGSRSSALPPRPLSGRSHCAWGPRCLQRVIEYHEQPFWYPLG